MPDTNLKKQVSYTCLLFMLLSRLLVKYLGIKHCIDNIIIIELFVQVDSDRAMKSLQCTVNK